MCREFEIISGLKKKDIKPIMDEYHISAEFDEISLGCMDHKTVTLVRIEEIDDKCLCNLITDEKVRVFDFIDKISIV